MTVQFFSELVKIKKKNQLRLNFSLYILMAHIDSDSTHVKVFPIPQGCNLLYSGQQLDVSINLMLTFSTGCCKLPLLQVGVS